MKRPQVPSLETAYACERQYRGIRTARVAPDRHAGLCGFSPHRLRPDARSGHRLSVFPPGSHAEIRGSPVPRNRDCRRHPRRAVRHLCDVALLQVFRRTTVTLADAGFSRLRVDLCATRRLHRDGAPQYLAVSALWTGVAPCDVDPALRWAALLQPAAGRRREAFKCARMAGVDWRVPDGGSGRGLDRPLPLRGSPGGTLV